MSRAIPICTRCTHVRSAGSRFPMCAHPEASRDPVDGSLSRTCFAERDTKGSFCGPAGDAFWPSSGHVGKPGVDGVGQPVNGV